MVFSYVRRNFRLVDSHCRHKRGSGPWLRYQASSIEWNSLSRRIAISFWNPQASVPSLPKMLTIPIVAGFGLLIILLYKYLLYPVFLSPLSKIPSAHITSSFSPLWILHKRRIGAENRAIHAAHQQYGPIVKLAPDQISVNCVDGGIKTVYSGGFEKSKWYHNMFDNYG